MNIKKVYERIEKEVHRWVEVPSESSTPFEVSREFNTMNLQFETDDPSEFFILLFSRMSNFYEKGFLFERGVPSATKDSSPSKSESDPWICSIAFNEGKVFLLSPSLEAEVPLPALDANKVTVSFPKDWELKSPSWKKLIPTEKKWTALSFGLNENLQMVMLTCLAEPWLKEQVEKTHRILHIALTEQP